MKKICLGLTLFFTFLVNANSAIVNIDSTNSSNTASLALTAGTYNATPIGIADGGAFDAWNAWGFSAGCDINGENCSNGYIYNFVIESSEFSPISVSSPTRYATPLLALTNNSDPILFSLSTNANVNFTIFDSGYSDNTGGISLDVQQSSSVPAPSIAWLLCIGLVGIIGRRRTPTLLIK